jgi:3-oxoadipate enol-lactonase
MNAASGPAIETIRVGPAPHIALDRAGSGELVLFLHGIGGNRTNWRGQIERFSSFCHAAAWDARGYGLSDDYEGPFDYADVAWDLLRVIDHFGAKRAHLVGLSMGGRIILDFHARHADRVASLTFVDTLPKSQPPDRRAEFLRLRQKPLLDGGHPREIAHAVASTLVSPRARPGAYEQLVASMEALRREPYLKAIAAQANIDRTDELARIRVPAAFIVGVDDHLTPPAEMRAAADRVQGSRYVEIVDAGHLSNIEQPEAFNAALDEFLRAAFAAAGADQGSGRGGHGGG